MHQKPVHVFTNGTYQKMMVDADLHHLHWQYLDLENVCFSSHTAPVQPWEAVPVKIKMLRIVPTIGKFIGHEGKIVSQEKILVAADDDDFMESLQRNHQIVLPSMVQVSVEEYEKSCSLMRHLSSVEAELIRIKQNPFKFFIEQSRLNRRSSRGRNTSKKPRRRGPFGGIKAGRNKFRIIGESKS